jgi:hypothetical protein
MKKFIFWNVTLVVNWCFDGKYGIYFHVHLLLGLLFISEYLGDIS